MVEAEEIFIIPDIIAKNSNACFTDGVGLMSPDIAREIGRELQSRARRQHKQAPYPRALQIRFQGSKGMLSVDYRLSSRAICIRVNLSYSSAIIADLCCLCSPV